jgi:hypothetical protein
MSCVGFVCVCTFCLSTCLPICPPAYASAHLPACLPLFLFWGCVYSVSNLFIYKANVVPIDN